MENINLILDAGSGQQPYKPEREDVIHIDFKFKTKNNFVLCDIEHLPFHEHVFTKVYCSHCLEHCLFPPYVLEEIKRVLDVLGHLEIRVPDMCYQSDYEQEDHYYTWTKSTLYNLLMLHFKNVKLFSNLRIHGLDTIEKFRLQGLIKFLRYVTKHEIVGFCYD